MTLMPVSRVDRPPRRGGAHRIVHVSQCRHIVRCLVLSVLVHYVSQLPRWLFMLLCNYMGEAPRRRAHSCVFCKHYVSVRNADGAWLLVIAKVAEGPVRDPAT